MTESERLKGLLDALLLIAETDPDWATYSYWDRGAVIDQQKAVARDAVERFA